MMRRLVAVAACLACVAGPVACAAEVPFAAHALELLESGGQSGVEERSFLVVADERTFRALYASIHAHRMPSPVPPCIEFGTHVVLVAFLGTRSTGGHRTGFGAMVVEGGAARVVVVERSPPPDALLTQAMTTPYAMATLTRANLETVELVDGTGAVVLQGTVALNDEKRDAGAVDSVGDAPDHQRAWPRASRRANPLNRTTQCSILSKARCLPSPTMRISVSEAKGRFGGTCPPRRRGRRGCN